ncbi:conserved unknown protein [Ectocarpus siliculosus]|uniref:Uncharacterized protein n=1 Tax=Ectocarpus siliculosus TaxID=2880 RepID=D7G7F6_ECTSI|nr:conserved unknown protein [Ectocarpus siliculosus]|eukprot:CBJ27698.1 conserved unknown protein [Ectocarpus siliculosus]
MVKAKAKKATMVKDVVGKVSLTNPRCLRQQACLRSGRVRESFHRLVTHTAPSSQRTSRGRERVIISTWDVSKPSVAKSSDRNLIKTNVMAIHYGNITAKDNRLFAQAHPEIRFAPPGSTTMEGGVRKKDKIPFDGPYGTKSEKMACPLSALIEARFTDFSQEGKDYPNVSVLEKKFRMPPPRETKASQGHNITLKPTPKQGTPVRPCWCAGIVVVAAFVSSSGKSVCSVPYLQKFFLLHLRRAPLQTTPRKGIVDTMKVQRE